MRKSGLLLATLAILLGSVTWCHALSVSLQWDPVTDPDVAGYKLHYEADSSTLPFSGSGAIEGASPISVGNLTSSTISGLDPSRSYNFAITAYNSTGIESSYSSIVSIPESLPPTISISYPANNSTASGTVSITATASDNIGITKVEYYVNGALQATDTTTPYVYAWNTSALATGAYVISTKAYDAAGNVGQSSNVNVTVVNDTIAPNVAVTAPVNNATVSGTTTLVANSSDNVGVSRVEFFRNGVLLTATNVAPYSYNWDTTTVTNGSYTLTAKAYDATGNMAQSAAVSVTVNNPVADTTAPTVSISAPANTATVSGTTSVTTTASDNVGVTKVEYYVNGVLQATDTTSPYSFSWNTTAVTNGSYILTAKAHDAAGNIGQTANVTVAVSNAVAPAPPGSYTAVFGNATGANYPNTIQDTFINVNYDVNAANRVLSTYTWPANKPANAIMMKWDVSALPANAQIQSATLSLYMTGSGGDGLYDIPVYEIINKSPVIANCNGYSHDGTNQWSPSSLPYNSIPLAQSDIATAVDAPQIDTTLGYKNWNVTAIINDWLANPANNRGLLLNASKNASSDSNRVFASSEATDSSQRPRLVVTYTLASDTTAPMVAINTPINGATVNGTVTVSTTASDNVGVSRVEFYVNGALQATDTVSPYTVDWNTTAVTNGAYTLTAKAYDAAGNVAQSSAVSLTVKNAVPDTTSPTVAISSPSTGAKLRTYATINASAADNVGVTKMELYIDNVLKTTTVSNVLTWRWNTSSTAKGSHVIKVNAFDAANNIGTTSITVNK